MPPVSPDLSSPLPLRWHALVAARRTRLACLASCPLLASRVMGEGAAPRLNDPVLLVLYLFLVVFRPLHQPELGLMGSREGSLHGDDAVMGVA